MTKVLIFDAETDGLLYQLTKFHCLGIEDFDTGAKWLFSERDGNLEEGIKMLETADVLIGHNILGFDLPAIEKVYPWFSANAKIRDTLIMSRLMWSDRDKKDLKLIKTGVLEGKYMGRHNLASWGQRLGYPKGDFSDWCEERGIDPWGDWGWEGEYTYVSTAKGDKYYNENGVEVKAVEDIETTLQWADIYQYRNDYCTQDVDVTSKLAEHILDTMDMWNMGDYPVYLEHRFEEIMIGIQRDGFHINVDRTSKLHDEIATYLEDFNAECAEAFPPAWVAAKAGGLIMPSLKEKLYELESKQELRVEKAMKKTGKMPKVYDYRQALTPLAEAIVDKGEFPDIKISARTAKMTHKFPAGVKVAGVEPDDKGISKLSYVMSAGTPHTPVEFKHFNPNSRLQIVDKLLDLGWEPEKYTDKGNPSTEGDILIEAAEEIPVALPIAGGLKCTKIKGYLKSKETKKDKNGWLDIVSKAGRIHARIVHIGAVTHRVALSRPNIGQIPSVTFYPKGHEKSEEVIMGFEGGWGWECRDCFIPPDGWVMMGCDLSGIEIRLFAEEMRAYDGGAYVEVVLDGDIHTTNQEAAGLPTRGAAKTFLYAVLYGIGDESLGASLDKKAGTTSSKKKVGKTAKTKFFKAIPAAKKVIKHYEKEAKKSGYIIAIDGRRVPCDSGHKALNSRLQNAGALVAKLWTILFYDAMLDAGYEIGYDGDFVIVAFVHDELQTACRTQEIADHAGRISEETALLAGEFFGIEIPTKAEFKTGKSWAETH